MYEVGIPSMFWCQLICVNDLRGSDLVLSLKEPFHLLICSTPTENDALIHAFSYLWIMRNKINGCAIPLDKVPDWNDSTFTGDLLVVYPVSPKSVNWQLQAIRNLWFKYSLIIPFSGTPSEFQSIIKLNATVINLRNGY